MSSQASTDDEIQLNDPQTLYRRWEDSQWSPFAIDLSEDVRQWAEMTGGDRDLLARDAHEVLGADLSSPAGLVACWTADGSLDGEGAGADGTRQALRIAHHHHIAVLNLARPADLRRLSKYSR